jgi:hypothetical protein
LRRRESPARAARPLRRVPALVVIGLVAISCGSSAGGQASSTSSFGVTSTSSFTSATASPASFSFPAAVSANHRYLLDQHGKPYLIVGDSPQCMSAQLSTEDMAYFFADRQAHGFNLAWVNLLCGTYTRGREDASTYDGIEPFTKPDDLSTPNPAYFARMDTMVDLAEQHGITLLLNPAETGSFRDLLKNNGIDKSRAYGAFVGERYKAAHNIIWMYGNDYQQDQWPIYDPFLVAMQEGLRAADPNKLHTVELNYNLSTSYDDRIWPPLIELASAYSYFPTYDVVLKAYNATPTQPVFMIEANYEFENNTGGPKTTDEALRRQEYWTMLSGATGQLYGNGYTWGLEKKSWKRHFDTKAVTELGLLVKFFENRPWQDLVPDQSHRFLTDGVGVYSSEGDVLENDYASAAVTADGTLGVAYIPTERTVTLDLSHMKSGVHAQWFDPTDGSYRTASAPFKTPGENAAGKYDWILVVEAAGGP